MLRPNGNEWQLTQNERGLYHASNHSCGYIFIESGSRLFFPSGEYKSGSRHRFWLNQTTKFWVGKLLDLRIKICNTYLFWLPRMTSNSRKSLESSRDNIQLFQNMELFCCCQFLPSSIRIWIHRPHWIRIRSKPALLYSVLTISSWRICSHKDGAVCLRDEKKSTWSNLVANRLRLVTMPPLGPSWYCFMTCLPGCGSALI